MRCECPELRRCCLCLPLRFGLIGTAWIKLVLDALCLMYVAFAIHVDGRRLPLFPIVFLSVLTVVVVLDVGFNGVLLRGCHKKDPVLLRLFYRYSLFLLGLNITFVLGIIIMDIVISVHSPFLWIITLYTFFTFLVFCVLSISEYVQIFYRYRLFLLGLNIAFMLGIIIMDIVISVHSPFVWIVTLYTFFTFLVFCVLSISEYVQIFYRYRLFLLGLNIAFMLGIIIMDIVISVHSPFVWILTLYTFFVFLMFCVLFIIIHLYLSILVRSEVQKLEATTQFQFTNTAAEAACTMAPGYTDIHPATNRPDNV